MANKTADNTEGGWSGVNIGAFMFFFGITAAVTIPSAITLQGANPLGAIVLSTLLGIIGAFTYDYNAGGLK